MRDTSSLEYDDPHDNNLYNLTLSSKVNTIELSGSRSRGLYNSQPRTFKGGDSIESVISTIPSMKGNKKQPPASLVPSMMNKNLVRNNESLRLKRVVVNNHIKISDE